MVAKKRIVWVTDVDDEAALRRLVRAALSQETSNIQMPAVNLDPGRHTLRLRLRGQVMVALAAEVQAHVAGSVFLRLAPLDPSHVPQLRAIVDKRAVPYRGPAKTLPDPEPTEVDESDLASSSIDDGEIDDGLAESTLFDPEAINARTRPVEDDTLTIDRRLASRPAPHAHASLPAHGKTNRRASARVGQDTGYSSIAPRASFPSEQTLEIETPRDVDRTSVPAPIAVEASRPSESDADDTIERPSDQSVTLPSPSGEIARASYPRDLAVRVDEDSETFPRTAVARISLERMSSRPPPAKIPSHMPRPKASPSEAAPIGGEQRIPAAVASSGASPVAQRQVTAQMLATGRILAGRYRIEHLVGSGAVGAVFKAAHIELPRVFAIKVLHPRCRADPQLIASFRAEARAASLLDHPNVAVVHDFGEEPDGLIYIVMEFLQGTNLQSLIDEEKRLSPRRTIEIMLQVCAALAAAHERGIVHRDVKPDNIMVVPTRDDEGRVFDLVKVCDFGIAALESVPGAGSEGLAAGTPEYMAPEQASGRADGRTDVYACGIVLYEMLIGRPPFQGATPTATVLKHINERPKRPSELVPGFPPALENVVMCAIEKQPERRFQTMRDLRVELRRLLD